MPGKNDKYIIFALQGNWIGGVPPKADKNGMISAGGVAFTLNKNNKNWGQFNYAIWNPSTQLWVDMNQAKGGGWQLFSVRKDVHDIPMAPGFKAYPGTQYY